MGADMYIHGKRHAENSFWPLMRVVNQARELLMDGKNEEALTLLNDANDKFDCYKNY